MTNKELLKLRQDILSLLTDKNVGFIQTENDDEQFGALMAFGYAFKNIYRLLEVVKK